LEEHEEVIYPFSSFSAIACSPESFQITPVLGSTLEAKFSPSPPLSRALGFRSLFFFYANALPLPLSYPSGFFSPYPALFLWATVISLATLPDPKISFFV